jgi:hypothetical protein
MQQDILGKKHIDTVEEYTKEDRTGKKRKDEQQNEKEKYHTSHM